MFCSDNGTFSDFRCSFVGSTGFVCCDDLLRALARLSGLDGLPRGCEQEAFETSEPLQVA